MNSVTQTRRNDATKKKLYYTGVVDDAGYSFIFKCMS